MFKFLKARADAMKLDGLEVPVASVTDLMAMKRAAGRPQDLMDLETLEVIQRRTRSSRRAP